MYRFVVVALLAMAGPLHAADADFDRAKLLVTDRLIDPGSAQFRRLLHPGSDTRMICGEVNARNRFGGYDGFKMFLVNLSTTPAMVIFAGVPGTDDSIVNVACATAIGRQAPK